MTPQELIRQRNQVLFTGSTEEIRKFMKRWGIPPPEDDAELWRRVYNAVLQIPEAPKAALRRAEYWLREYEKGEKIDA